MRICFGDRIVGRGGGSLHSFLLSEQNSWRVNVAGRKYYKRTHLAPKQNPRNFALPLYQKLAHVVQIMLVHQKADKEISSFIFIFSSLYQLNLSNNIKAQKNEKLWIQIWLSFFLNMLILNIDLYQIYLY